MSWSNSPLTVYHGCDDQSAQNIISSGVNLTFCKPLTDFGQGFYTTTNLNQAKSWANMRIKRIPLRRSGITISTVLKFDIDRDLLAQREILFFIIEGGTNSDYWNFVGHCRNTSPAQHNLKYGRNYDVVAGLVSLWPQRLLIKDCDQISFHTLRALSLLPQAQIFAQGNPLF